MQEAIKVINSWHAETLGNRVVNALHKNGFGAEYVSSIEEAKKRVLEQIPDNVSVGFGGSLSIMSMGIQADIQEKGCTIFNHNTGETPEDSVRIGKLANTADIYLSSTNALTMDGRLVNTDSRGNRVAAMIHGSGKVIIVAGSNKLVETVEDAMNRIEQVVAPKLAKSIELIQPELKTSNNPCLKTGVCMDCNSPSRICNVTTILHKNPAGANINVIVVGEPIGF